MYFAVIEYCNNMKLMILLQELNNAKCFIIWKNKEMTLKILLHLIGMVRMTASIQIIYCSGSGGDKKIQDILIMISKLYPEIYVNMNTDSR